jgi:hypothetical protein
LERYRNSLPCFGLCLAGTVFSGLWLGTTLAFWLMTVAVLLVPISYFGGCHYSWSNILYISLMLVPLFVGFMIFIKVEDEMSDYPQLV